MAITLNTVPARIDKSGAFNVTTSLVEDSTHVNLRLRADLYHEGIIKAVIERPKGLSDFDFADILKSLTPGLKFARDISDYGFTGGTIDSQLINSFASRSGTWTTLTTAGNAISAAVCTAASVIESDAIAMVAGELYLFSSIDFANTGTNPFVYLETGGPLQEIIQQNKSILLMPTTTGNIKILIGNTGTENFSGTFSLNKIITNRSTVGSPLAPYFVNFTEVYEDAAGVTQAGASSKTALYRYVPAIGDGTAFTEYVLHDSTCLFANKTLRNNITKFFTFSPNEYWLQFYTEYNAFVLYYSVDGAAYTTLSSYSSPEGWGVIKINKAHGLFSTVTTSLRIYLKVLSPSAITISEVITIYPEPQQIDERVVLEFDGLVGGKEYLAFEGLKSLEFDTFRQYFTSSKKMRKPISLTGLCRQKIETRFKDMANAEYLKSLLISEDVKRLEPSYATPIPVTITTDGVKIDGGTEMFTNRLDMEYEY